MPEALAAAAVELAALRRERDWATTEASSSTSSAFSGVDDARADEARRRRDDTASAPPPPRSTATADPELPPAVDPVVMVHWAEAGSNVGLGKFGVADAMAVRAAGDGYGDEYDNEDDDDDGASDDGAGYAGGRGARDGAAALVQQRRRRRWRWRYVWRKDGVPIVVKPERGGDDVPPSDASSSSAEAAALAVDVGGDDTGLAGGAWGRSYLSIQSVSFADEVRTKTLSRRRHPFPPFRVPPLPRRWDVQCTHGGRRALFGVGLLDRSVALPDSGSARSLSRRRRSRAIENRFFAWLCGGPDDGRFP